MKRGRSSRDEIYLVPDDGKKSMRLNGVRWIGGAFRRAIVPLPVWGLSLIHI